MYDDCYWGASKLVDSINLIFFASAEEGLFQDLLPGWVSLWFLGWENHEGAGCEEG